MAREYVITDSPAGKLKLIARNARLIAIPVGRTGRSNRVKLGERPSAQRSGAIRFRSLRRAIAWSAR